MKKWLFSKNGKVLGPYAVDKANDFVISNPDSYAWHPSYSHWMPVTCINEFEDSIPTPKPPSVIPKELIEEFIGEERKLITRLAQLDEHLLKTDQSLIELDNEIKEFQEITQNCTAEVRATLQSIEQQFANLSKNLSNFKSITVKGKKELTDISDNFNTRLEEDNQTQVELPNKSKTVKTNSQPLPEEFSEALVERKTNQENSIQESTIKTDNVVTNKDSHVNNTQDVFESLSTIKKRKIISTAASSPLNQVSMLQPKASNSDVAIAEADDEVIESKKLANTEQNVVVDQANLMVEENDNVVDKNPSVETLTPKPPTKIITVEKIEFNDKPSKEDILLASQLKAIDKPITFETSETTKLEKSLVGEFDHILYDSIDTEEVVDEDKGKKRLRRRRRR